MGFWEVKAKIKSIQIDIISENKLSPRKTNSILKRGTTNLFPWGILSSAC